MDGTSGVDPRGWSLELAVGWWLGEDQIVIWDFLAKSLKKHVSTFEWTRCDLEKIIWEVEKYMDPSTKSKMKL